MFEFFIKVFKDRAWGWSGGDGALKMRLWDEAEEVKLPRWGFGMGLRDGVSRDEALGWSWEGRTPEMKLWDGAEEVESPEVRPWDGAMG